MIASCEVTLADERSGGAVVFAGTGSNPSIGLATLSRHRASTASTPGRRFRRERLPVMNRNSRTAATDRPGQSGRNLPRRHPARGAMRERMQGKTPFYGRFRPIQPDRRDSKKQAALTLSMERWVISHGGRWRCLASCGTIGSTDPTAGKPDPSLSLAPTPARRFSGGRRVVMIMNQAVCLGSTA